MSQTPPPEPPEDPSASASGPADEPSGGAEPTPPSAPPPASSQPAEPQPTAGASAGGPPQSGPPASPPPPAEPGWSDAAPGPEGPDRNGVNKRKLLLVGALGLLVVGIIAALLVLRDDDDDDDDDSASDRTTTSVTGDSGGTGTDEDDEDDSVDGDLEEVVRDYFDAYNDGDCEGMADEISASSYESLGQTREEALSDCESAADAGAFDTEINVDDIEVLDQQADNAELEVTVTVDERTEAVPMVLVREGDDWKIDAESTFS